MIDHRRSFFFSSSSWPHVKSFQPLAQPLRRAESVSTHPLRDIRTVWLCPQDRPQREKRASRQLQKRRRQKKSSNLRKKGPSRRREERLGKEENPLHQKSLQRRPKKRKKHRPQRRRKLQGQKHPSVRLQRKRKHRRRKRLLKAVRRS